MFSRLSLRSSSSSLLPCRRFLSTETACTPKISQIVSDIASLNLLENAELVKELKVRLNIKDIAMPAFSAAPAASSAAVVEEAPVVVEKTSFTIKLEKFDAAAKAKMIREIKGLIPGANLVAAKKFVESVPAIIREDVPKEEAEKIKATLEGLGGTVVLE